MLRLVLVTLLVSSVAARICTKVNGISGACDLKLNQFTLAGTHNSGSGATGVMWHWSGIAASSCWYRNQMHSIKEQLDLGVRYFDFDVSYVKLSEESSPYWEEGIVLVHSNSYGKSLKRALQQISDFMNSNGDAVIVIRIKDVDSDRRGDVESHIQQEFRWLENRMNSNRNPKLGDAISQDRRLFLFVNGGIKTNNRYHLNLGQIESFDSDMATSGCYSVDDIVKKLRSDRRIGDSYYAIQVDWYFTAGLCIRELAGLCNDGELNKLETINKRMLAKGPGVNLVMIDYVGTGDVRLADVVKRMNIDNVNKYT